MKALTKGDYVLYFKKYYVKGIFVLFFGCFICVIDVVLELCITSDSFKDETCIIDPRQSLRTESMWLYREKIEKRPLKRERFEKEGRCYIGVPTFIQVDPSG